ncbi:hypothetical protein C9374_000144 [Naegleria lovaniensis]|uniref:tRNA:m(4)X modification enzyme TRM13 n=1 Tax=Naegleria lovaniensis TaxID=51637 RepID=A0AA88KM87_NAELO|nr:uncharacterized protein C9374_000144 [Naegleria lovaniensis]KAG2388705.1 hypothetical protein C9374_000144 [Naegleria lovaniensis]
MIPQQQQQHTTKSSKRSATPPPPPPQQQHPTQCHFYVKQKHRFCKRERAPNSLYCHTHTIFEHDSNLNSLTLETTTTMTTTTMTATTMTTMTTCLPQIPNDHSQPSSLKRVPCPIDPSHSVYEYRLKKHLKICNKSLSQNRMMQQPYYCPSIHYNYLKKNHTQDLNILYHNPQDLKNNDTNKDLYKNDRMISFQTIGDLVKNHSEYFKNLISKINHLYDHQLQIKTIIQDHMNENYNFLSDDEEFREKHHKQHCSIIYNIEHAHCLSNDFDYIEFGCGKGTLSYCVRRALIAQRREITMCNSSSNFNNYCRNSSHTSHESNNMVISNQTFILIDRENQRRKVDNFIKYGTRLHNNKNQPQDGMLATEIVHVERILADIGDLDLSRVKCLNVLKVLKSLQVQPL